jgi:hypothetical protein
MKDFFISEMFKLEIRWEGVSYNKKGVCFFDGAFFSGPAISIAEEIKHNDSIMLDFYSQYIKLVRGVYVGNFSWKDRHYSKDGNIVLLDNATLYGKYELNNVPTLKKDDFFVIDTSNHTPEKHGNNLLYKTYLVNSDNYLYRFSNA